MLRVDSAAFVSIALVLVVSLRVLPRPVGRGVYAGVSLLVYALVMPNAAALMAAAVFVFWPWLLVVRRRRHALGLLIPVFITVQTLMLLWSRRYFAHLPPLASTPLVSQALAILGISYIILRQVDLIFVLDAEPDEGPSLLDYTAFMLGVFTLLAGPIISYRSFRARFLFPAERETSHDLVRAGHRIVNGYLKVSVLSPLLYHVSSLGTLHEADASLRAWLLFFYVYPLYIYANFSGYCDVVIGFGRLARIDIPENFDHPYSATNIQVYWQRWHLTFSHWIRSYLFFPLMRAFAGSRVGAPLAVLFTFLIVGLWHGTDPGFAVFGLLHGLGVLVVTPYARLLDRCLSPSMRERYEHSRPSRWLRMAACYHYLCFSMLFFERPLAQVAELLR